LTIPRGPAHHDPQHSRHRHHSTSELRPPILAQQRPHSSSGRALTPTGHLEPPRHTRNRSHSPHRVHFSNDIQVSQPLMHPAFGYSAGMGRKKALCIGINYRGYPNELKGCVNDAKNVRSFLIRYAGYKEGDIVLLTDDHGQSSRQLPTKQNIIDAMHWLVKGAQPNDSLFFHCKFPYRYPSMF